MTPEDKMLTEKQHQEWKRDLEELHEIKAENKRLREAIRKIKRDYEEDRIGSMLTVIRKALKEKLGSQAVEIKKLRKALDEYGCHDFECDESGLTKCICGFEQAVKETKSESSRPSKTE